MGVPTIGTVIYWGLYRGPLVLGTPLFLSSTSVLGGERAGTFGSLGKARIEGSKLRCACRLMGARSKWGYRDPTLIFPCSPDLDEVLFSALNPPFTKERYN